MKLAAARPATGAARSVEVWIGEEARVVGTLGYSSSGQRQSSAFLYDEQAQICCAHPKPSSAARRPSATCDTCVDDHLHNHGFLHAGHGQWRLSPAFDLNPFPDKDRELKTWRTEETGPTGSIDEAVGAAPRFRLTRKAAIRILGEVERAIVQWREVARSREVGMTAKEAAVFEPAFEHPGREEARRWLR